MADPIKPANAPAKEFIILGTEYAGEMKKGVFTMMNYVGPKRGIPGRPDISYARVKKP